MTTTHKKHVGKVAVMGMRERGGRTHAKPIASVDTNVEANRRRSGAGASGLAVSVCYPPCF